MKTKLINTALIVLVATVLTLLATFVRVGATADSVAVLKTAGMTCSSCSGTITRALEKQNGVAATEVDIEGGWVIVGYDTKQVTPEALAAMVRASGFTSVVAEVVTPEQFKQVTGRAVGQKSSAAGCGCCAKKRS